MKAVMMCGSSILIRQYACSKKLTASLPATTEIYHSIASILFNGAEKLFFGRAFQWSKLFPPLESFPLTVPFVAAESWILHNVCQQLYDFTISFQLCLQPIVFCPTHPLLRIFRSFCFSLAFVYCLVVQSRRTLVQCSPVSADLAWSGHLQLCNLCRFPWLNFRPYYWG